MQEHQNRTSTPGEGRQVPPTSIGRIVHIHVEGAIKPAIITTVLDNYMVNVVVFDNDIGVYSQTSIPYSDLNSSVYWLWPPRV